MRREAVIALGYLGEFSTLEAVVDRIGDADASVRRAAVGAAVAFVPEIPVAEFARAAQDPDWQVRREAVIALAQFPSDAVEAALAATLRDPAWQVVKEASLAAGKLKLAIVEDLLPLLRRPEPDLRKVTSWALGEIGRPGAIDFLRTVLEDEDGDVRKTASRSIERLKTLNPETAFKLQGTP